MLELSQIASGHEISASPETLVILTYDQRTRSRLRTTLDDGRDAGLYLVRGQILKDGDMLISKQGEYVVVKAANEPVSAVYTQDPLELARLCYHLGNRHVNLQIGHGRIAYLADHVLDDMVRGLNADPIREDAPFEPESGAYGGAHRHEHG